MTKEEIINAGIDYTLATRPVCICGEAFGDMREFNRNSAFEEGAKWCQEGNKKLFIELFYNLMEIGDIEVHDINKDVELINKKIEE